MTVTPTTWVLDLYFDEGAISTGGPITKHCSGRASNLNNLFKGSVTLFWTFPYVNISLNRKKWKNSYIRKQLVPLSLSHASGLARIYMEDYGLAGPCTGIVGIVGIVNSSCAGWGCMEASSLDKSNCWRGPNKYSNLLTRSIYSTI